MLLKEKNFIQTDLVYPIISGSKSFCRGLNVTATYSENTDLNIVVFFLIEANYSFVTCVCLCMQFKINKPGPLKAAIITIHFSVNTSSIQIPYRMIANMDKPSNFDIFKPNK